MRRNTPEWEQWHKIRGHRINLPYEGAQRSGWRCRKCGSEGDMTTADDRILPSLREMRRQVRRFNALVKATYGVSLYEALSLVPGRVAEGLWQKLRRALPSWIPGTKEEVV